MLEVVNRLHRLAAQDLGSILIHQVITALDGVEHVPFPMVFFQVAESRTDPPLGRPRVRAHGIQLTNHRHAPV